MRVERGTLNVRHTDALLAPASTLRAYPDDGLEDAELNDAERRHALGLMRINHCGEVCAQALYQGQALTARDPVAREALKEAAWEETEHLAWTERRIAELGGHKSVLNPVWYVGSLAMGVTAGLLGEKYIASLERMGSTDNAKVVVLPADLQEAVRGLVGGALKR